MLFRRSLLTNHHSNMQKIPEKLFPLLVATLLSSASLLWGGQPLAGISLHNPSDFPRSEETVVIGLKDLGVSQSEWQTGIFEVHKEGIILPSQTIDTDGDSLRDSILLLLSFEANESIDLDLVRRHQGEEVSVSPKRTQVDLSIRVGGEWVEGKRIGNIERGNWEYVGGKWADVRHLKVPQKHSDHSNYIRYEGVGIESDLVGYRFYLDWRHGFDVFGKTTPHMVLKEVGLDGFESYHEMLDWGMDILKVGDAVGIGGYGYWDGEKVIRVSDVAEEDCRLLENGYLRSSMRLDYQDWQAGDQQINLSGVLSMQAGSRLVDVQLTTETPVDGICTGIVKLENTETIRGSLEIPDDHWSYLATWGQQSLDGGNLGLAILFRKDSLEQITEDDLNEVVVLKSDDQRYRYYFLAAWQGEPNGIRTLEAFKAYLKNTTDRLSSPIAIRVKTEE